MSGSGISLSRNSCHAARVFEHQVADIDVEVTEEHNPRLAAERFRLELTSAAAGKVIRVVSRRPPRKRQSTWPKTVLTSNCGA